MNVLDAELKTYDEHRDELLGTAEGKYVLIHGADLVGIFDAEGDAIREGYERFGNVPFLVKMIERVETAQNFVSNILAV